MKRNMYEFAYRNIETATVQRTGLLASMLNLRSKFRASRGYGSMKTYYVRNH